MQKQPTSPGNWLFNLRSSSPQYGEMSWLEDFIFVILSTRFWRCFETTSGLLLIREVKVIFSASESVKRFECHK